MLDTLMIAEKFAATGMEAENAKRAARAFYRAQLEGSADYLADDLRAAGFPSNQAELIARMVAAKLAGRDFVPAGQ